MSETPRKPEEQAGETVESPAVDSAGAGQETADQPTVNLQRDEPAEPLLEDEPAEYELPEPAPRRAESAGGGPSAGAGEPGDERGAASEPPEDPGLPTSDPVFPTASPQLKPPVAPTPGDVSGFGTPAGPESERAPQTPPSPSGGPASVASGAASPAAPSAPGSSAPAAPAPSGAPATGVARPLPPTGPPRQRSAAEIRADIEAGRQELSQSVEVLRDKVEELTDWRGQVRKHRREITIAAAAVGFVVGARFMMKRRRR